MTNHNLSFCEEVRIAAMARLDGEPASMSSDEVQKHVAGCTSCATAIAELTAIHGGLERIEYEGPAGVDLWPAVQQEIGSTVPYRKPKEGRVIVALAALVVAWRLAQLLLDLPAPVLNALAPLAVVVFLLRRLAKDPFAIQPSMNQFEQKGVL